MPKFLVTFEETGLYTLVVEAEDAEAAEALVEHERDMQKAVLVGVQEIVLGSEFGEDPQELTEEEKL